MTQAAKPGAISLLILVLMLVLIMAATAAKMSGLIDGDAATRYVGGVFSCLMVGTGNLLPKSAVPGSPAGKSARFAGWLLVAGGLLSLGLWVWAPPEIRIVSACSAALSLFAAALLAAVWPGKRGVSQGPSESSRRNAGTYSAIVHILHALMWAFAIFVAATLFGKQTVLWMTMAFSVCLLLLQQLVSSCWKPA